jgi:tetratricopeptide (TPR) repeat protein
MESDDHEQASRYLTQALEVARAGSSTRSQAQVMFWQGMHALRQQRYDTAEDLFRQVLELIRKVGDRYGEAQAIRGLGLCHRGQEDYTKARASLLEALRLIRQPSPTIIETRIQQDLSELDGLKRARRNRQLSTADRRTEAQTSVVEKFEGHVAQSRKGSSHV